jgi:hypothetical protein
MSFNVDFQVRRRVQGIIAGLFILILLTSHRDPQSGLLVSPRGWVAVLILGGVIAFVFRDVLVRMGYRGHL